MYNVITVFKIHLKLLLRNRVLLAIFFFIYALIVYLQLRKQSDLFAGVLTSYANASSFIPYMNVFFLHLPIVTFNHG